MTTKPKDTKLVEEKEFIITLSNVVIDKINEAWAGTTIELKWLKKLLTQTQQDTVQDIIKDANNHMETSEDEELRNFWYQVTVWLETIKKKMGEGE